MVGVTPLDRATLSLVVFRPRPRHVRSIVFTKLIVIVRFFWFVVWMWFTALQVGNIKQGWKNPDHSLSSITFLIQLSIKLGTFHLMIGQCHAIIKCKGIHKSQLQSWRRNTFLCHRLERAFFWWPSSMFITTPSPWNTCPVPSSLSAIAPEKKCEMCVTVVTIASFVTELRRHRGRVTRPWPEDIVIGALTMMDISGTPGPQSGQSLTMRSGVQQTISPGLQPPSEELDLK